MLQSFISTSDIKKYHPTIDDNLWINTSDFNTQISLGLSRLSTDLSNKDIDERLVMIPYNLMNLTVTTSRTGNWTEVPSKYKRFVSTITYATGSTTVQLFGSHNKSSSTLVSTLELDDNGVVHTELSSTYKYYQTVATTTSAIVKAELYETAFDKAILLASLIYICRDFMKEADDMWDIRRRFAETDYSDALNSLKYYYDSQDDEDPANDTEQKAGSILWVR
jgi:hypothetical protein